MNLKYSYDTETFGVSFFAGPAHMMAQTVLFVTHEGKSIHKPALCVLPCSMLD